MLVQNLTQSSWPVNSHERRAREIMRTQAQLKRRAYAFPKVTTVEPPKFFLRRVASDEEEIKCNVCQIQRHQSDESSKKHFIEEKDYKKLMSTSAVPDPQNNECGKANYVPKNTALTHDLRKALMISPIKQKHYTAMEKHPTKVVDSNTTQSSWPISYHERRARHILRLQAQMQRQALVLPKVPTSELQKFFLRRVELDKEADNMPNTLAEEFNEPSNNRIIEKESAFSRSTQCLQINRNGTTHSSAVQNDKKCKSSSVAAGQQKDHQPKNLNPSRSVNLKYFSEQNKKYSINLPEEHDIDNILKIISYIFKQKELITRTDGTPTVLKNESNNVEMYKLINEDKVFKEKNCSSNNLPQRMESLQAINFNKKMSFSFNENINEKIVKEHTVKCEKSRTKVKHPDFGLDAKPNNTFNCKSDFSKLVHLPFELDFDKSNRQSNEKIQQNKTETEVYNISNGKRRIVGIYSSNAKKTKSYKETD